MTVKNIELVEYVPTEFPRGEIAVEEAEVIWREYGKQVDVEFPSIRTDYKWKLTSIGYVGYIPVTPDFRITLRPKTSLGNLFRMWEYAYKVDFRFFEDIYDCSSLEEFYERLANVLSKRVLARVRKGLYRAYVPEEDRLPYVRGRLETRRTWKMNWDVKPECRYEEHTADIDDNRILSWTLWLIARSRLCKSDIAKKVHKAYLSLHGFTGLYPFDATVCLGREYSRLNDDYKPMHALCRFFLENSGPTHKAGENAMLPFVVNMADLYERFVAAWLAENIPPGYAIEEHENVHVGSGGSIKFDIDIVLKDAETGRTLSVIDTKYKTPDRPSNEDISQVVTYAEAKGCRDAVLVYPEPLLYPVDDYIGNIRVRSIAFELAGSLDEAGTAFTGALLEGIGCS
jgi:5-methylcytosine-specific restriction enzyme subunit McrC